MLDIPFILLGRLPKMDLKEKIPGDVLIKIKELVEYLKKAGYHNRAWLIGSDNTVYNGAEQGLSAYSEDDIVYQDQKMTIVSYKVSFEQ